VRRRDMCTCMTGFSKMRKSYTKSPKKVVYKKQRPELVMARYIPRDMPEVKTRDTALTLVSGTTQAFGTPQVLNNIGLFSSAAVPNAVDARIGRKIYMTSITMKLNVPSTPGRLIVVYDKQANGQLPPANSYLVDNTDITSLVNLSNKERFIILMDQWIPDPNALGYPSSGTIIPMTFYRKINKEALFNDAGTTVGNNVFPATGSVVIGYANVGATALTIDGNVRIRFTDA